MSGARPERLHAGRRCVALKITRERGAFRARVAYLGDDGSIVDEALVLESRLYAESVVTGRWLDWNHEALRYAPRVE